MTRFTKILPLAVAALALVVPSRAAAAQAHAGHGQPAASASEKPAPLGDSARAAVEEALRDELRGEAMYARVLKDHGDVRPFSNVVRAERRHAAFLEDVLKARGLAVPEAPAGEIPAYASVKEACAAAVAFEVENVALYDRLLAKGPLPDDVKRAFDHNRMASLDHHKPAFERCAGVATVSGAQGGGRGHGHGAARGAAACGGGGRCGGEGCGPGCGHGCGCGCGHGCGCGRGGGRGYGGGCGHGHGRT
jgi:hypothetical protein